jgi:hypothetical protein
MRIIVKLIILIFFFIICQKYLVAYNGNGKNNFIAQPALLGKWFRFSQLGPILMEFKSDNTVEVDFGNDQTVDVVTDYKIKNDTIHFLDKSGEMCPELGVYQFEINDYYICFNLLDDLCNGRIKITMGYWTKANFHDLICELSERIKEKKDTDLNLLRVRIFFGNERI